MKTKATVLLIMVIGFTFLLAACLKDKGYYEMGKDRITSIVAVVGERKMTGTSTSTSNGVQTKTWSYTTDPDDPGQASNDLATYITHLMRDEGFFVTISIDGLPADGGVPIQLAKESVDEGKVIIINIVYNSKGYTIELNKLTDTITYY